MRFILLCLMWGLLAVATPVDAVTIALVGDSTVTDDAGWGAGFKAALADDAKCISFAQGGRSSKSFRDEGHWDKALASKAEYVLIQFGHNDQPGKGPERETDPATTFPANLKRYVEEARKAGMKPIIVTSLVRRKFGEDGKIKSDLVAYADAAKRAAAEAKVPLIDLHALSIELCNRLGPEGCAKLSPINQTGASKGSIDTTHLNAEGSRVFGQLVARELARVVPELAGAIRSDALPTKSITVAADGSGDHRTLQAAIDAVPDGNKQRLVIRIKPGTYKERITIPKEKTFITLRGEAAAKTILSWHWNAKHVEDDKEVGTSGSYSTLVSADDFEAENITFQNTAGDTGQAVALRTNGMRQVFRNCRMIGWQDTLYLHNGSAYFKDCHIEGRVDFIFGRGVAVFESCTIKSKNGGYVTAAATEPDQPWGYVFLDCKLTSDDNVPTYLGRPWRPNAAVAFVRCHLGRHIRPEGWDNWRNPENEKTARYYEYRCTGPGAGRSKRVAWAKELTDEQAKSLTPQNVLGDWAR